MDMRHDRKVPTETLVLSRLRLAFCQAERTLVDTAGKVRDAALARMLYQVSGEFERMRCELGRQASGNAPLSGTSQHARLEEVVREWRAALEAGDSYSLLWEIERLLVMLLQLIDETRRSLADPSRESWLSRQQQRIRAQVRAVQRLRDRYDPFASPADSELCFNYPALLTIHHPGPPPQDRAMDGGTSTAGRGPQR